uniref:DNA replication ATP-dependent helicase/nuclease n=1 Tax=Elaeophora elaphi TaxID=1147741 RepID=A0A0R3RSD8_9BILA
MEWPKFDFVKRSHRLSARKSNASFKKGRPQVCRSLVVDFENVKCRKKGSSTKENSAQNHQQVLPNSDSLICLQGNPFQMNGKINIEKIPPLSPILVKGFLKNPVACPSMPLKESNSNLEEMLTSSRHIHSINLASGSISRHEDPIVLESLEPIFTSPHSDGSSTSVLQSAKVTQRNQTFGSQSQITASFVAVAEGSDNLNSKCRKGDKNASHSPKLRASPFIASTSADSFDSHLSYLETLPPSQIDCKNLDKNESLPDLDFISSQQSSESNEPITIRHARSDNDVLQTHTVCVDDSESFTSGSEHSRDCFLDVTIHEIEPNDLALETAPLLQNTSSSITNQLGIRDLREENDETTHQKQYHRLSKLAEALKKRLFISSSDLAMWKCEEPKQQPIRQIAVISSVEQWGFCWTLVKNVSSFETAQIVDSEPMKKTIDVRSRSGKARNASNDEKAHRQHDLSQGTSEGTFFLYQPLLKLNTSSGEFILSPRYYR